MPIAVRGFGWLLVVLSISGAIGTAALMASDHAAEDVVGSAAAVLVIGSLGGLILFRKPGELRTRGMPAVDIDPLSEQEKIVGTIPPQVDDELGQLWHQW
jgi:hypothetical protein